MDDVLFEVVTPTASPAARRLTTAANVRAVIGSPIGDDSLLEQMIDRVSAAAAKYCNLAQDAIGTPPTFGRETCRATWLTSREGRTGKLLLPWRVPVVSVTSIVEDGATLVGTDYRLRLGAILERLSDGAPVRWLSGQLVVVYVTGWDLVTNGAPPDLEAAVIDQVKAMYQGRKRDGNMRSFTASEVSMTFADAGAAETFECALDAYRVKLL
jgi:hypothetical protein